MNILRSNKKYLLIFIVLLFVFLFLKNKFNNSVKTDHYAVRKVEEITSVKLSNKENTLTFVKNENGWTSSSQWPVKKQSMEAFLNVTGRIEIKTPLSDETAEKYLSEIKSNGISVKIYKEKKILQSYVFYESYFSGTVSFLFDETKERLFLIKIPGYDGKLAGFININEGYWKENTLLYCQPNEIASISVFYKDAPELSYIVTHDSLTQYSLFNTQIQKLYSSPTNIQKYFSYFRNVSFEKEYTRDEINHLDTLFYYASLEIDFKINYDIKLNFYKIPEKEPQPTSQFDLNYILVKKYPENQFFKVKYLEIDLLLKDLQYFK